MAEDATAELDVAGLSWTRWDMIHNVRRAGQAHSGATDATRTECGFHSAGNGVSAGWFTRPPATGVAVIGVPTRRSQIAFIRACTCWCSSSTAAAGCTLAASPRTPLASGRCSRPVTSPSPSASGSRTSSSSSAIADRTSLPRSTPSSRPPAPGSCAPPSRLRNHHCVHHAGNSAGHQPNRLFERHTAQFTFGRRGCRRCSTASWWPRIKIPAVFHASSCRDSRSHAASRVIRRNMNRRHMIGDHHGRSARRATLLVRAADGILGTHNGKPKRQS
jgi:hypothetical protein